MAVPFPRTDHLPELELYAPAIATFVKESGPKFNEANASEADQAVYPQFVYEIDPAVYFVVCTSNAKPIDPLPEIELQF